MGEPAGSHVATVGELPPRAGGLRERLLAFRDRLLGNPSFHRAAARFPLTRPIARRRARALFDLSAGFVYSQILFACVRAGLFDLLADGPRSTAAIASATGLPEEGALRLLRGAAALRLVQGAGNGFWRLGEQGAVMLGNASIGAMVSHHERLYADLADPLALLGGRADTNLARLWPYAAGERDAMAAEEVARAVLDGQADLGILNDGGILETGQDGGDLVKTELGRDVFCLVCPEGHPLARKRLPRWRDLDGCDLVMLDHQTGSRALIDAVLDETGITVRPVQEMSRPESVIALVAAGMGVAVLPELAAPGDKVGGLSTRRLTEPTAFRRMVMIHAADILPNGAVAMAADMMTQAAKDRG